MTRAQGAGIYSESSVACTAVGTCGAILNVFDSEIKNNRSPMAGGGLRLTNGNGDPLTATLRNVIFDANEVYTDIMGAYTAIGFSTGHSVYIDTAAGAIIASFEGVNFRNHAGRTYEFCQVVRATEPPYETKEECYERGAGAPAPKEPAIVYSTMPGA